MGYNNLLKIGGPIGILIGVAGIGFSIYETSQNKKVAEKVDLTIREISEKETIDIQDALVNKAIERAVEREVRIAVADTARRVREDIHDTVKNEVRKEIEREYNKISEEVSDKISEQVAQIDEYALKKRVEAKAEEKVMRKLDGCLDGALGMFNNQLGNVNKIYQNIQETLSGGKSNRDINLRLS